MEHKVPVNTAFFKGFSTVGAKEEDTLNPYFFDASNNFDMGRALGDACSNYEMLLQAMKDKSKVKRVMQAVMTLCAQSENPHRKITLSEIADQAGLTKDKTREKLPRVNRHLKAAFLKSQGNSANCVLGQRSLKGYQALKVKKGGVEVKDFLLAAVLYGESHKGPIARKVILYQNGLIVMAIKAMYLASGSKSMKWISF